MTEPFISLAAEADTVNNSIFNFLTVLWAWLEIFSILGGANS